MTAPTEAKLQFPTPSELMVSSSPHLHDTGALGSVRRIMGCVIIALMPACGTGIYFFGLKALWVLLTCVIACLLCEWVWNALLKKTQTLNDLSAVVSGLILGMNFSAGIPLWLCILGAFVTMVIGKLLYGGLGYNPFNPAAVGRVFLLLSFPSYMTVFVPVSPLFSDALPAAETTATPLRHSVELAATNGLPYVDYFVGNMPGCLGETSAFALLCGGLFLIALKIIKWEVPLTYLATLALMTLLVSWGAPESVKYGVLLDVPFQLLTGGAVLAAFFMCTDMVTTPVTTRGAILFAFGAGVLTASIRFWGGYPEGASFSILLMNALTPLIDKLTVPKPFGTAKGGAQ